jgi:cell division protein FtsN
MVLGVACLALLAVTFGFGVLVGRHRARQAQPAIAAEPSRKAAPVPRRSGLTEPGPERPPQLQERLTFYQTLKEPLGPVRPPQGASAAVKPAGAGANPARSPQGGPGQATDRDAREPSRPVADVGEARPGPSTRGEPERPEGLAGWTVQIGVFSSPQQAAVVKKQLAHGGFEADIALTTADDGHVRYRVRLGTFRSREEAVRTAERVRSDRALPTYVTTR